MKQWALIAGNLKKAGWTYGYISAIDSNGRTIWIAPKCPRPVPKVNKRQLRIALKQKAQEVLAKRGKNPEVRRRVEALLESIDDTLSDETILEELILLNVGGVTFLKTFADNSPKS